MIKGAYGVSEQANVYVKLGMASLEADDIDYSGITGGAVGVADFKGDLGFAFGTGVNATFYDQDDLKIGAGLHISYLLATEDTIREVANVGSLKGEVTLCGICTCSWIKLRGYGKPYFLWRIPSLKN